VVYSTQLERFTDALCDSNRLLILDEAGTLTDPAIELLRAIHGTTGVPVLLPATKDLHERIVKRADPDHGQLYSRFDVIWYFSSTFALFSVARRRERGRIVARPLLAGIVSQRLRDAGVLQKPSWSKASAALR